MTRNSWITMVAGAAIVLLVMAGLVLASSPGSEPEKKEDPAVEEPGTAAVSDITQAGSGQAAAPAPAPAPAPDTAASQSGVSTGTANNINYEDYNLYNKGT